MHILEVLDADLGVELSRHHGSVCAYLVLQDRCSSWTVGSLPYLPCHLVTCPATEGGDCEAGRLAEAKNIGRRR